MCKANGVGKVSRRDIGCIPCYRQDRRHHSCYHHAHSFPRRHTYIRHRRYRRRTQGATETMDISAGSAGAGPYPVAVICAGAKSILDIGLTLEYLETMGVPVVGVDTDDFPAFYCRKERVQGRLQRKKDANEIARIIKTKWDVGLEGGALIANPIPKEYELDFDEMETVINRALSMAKEQGIHGKDTTPSCSPT